MNTFLLVLLVIAAYANLFFTIKRDRKKARKTQLPISSKEYSQAQKDVDNNSLTNENFKVWFKNREMLDK